MIITQKNENCKKYELFKNFMLKEKREMEILYNQYYKSGAKGTLCAKEKAMALEFLETDNEHHDIGFKYETEDRARNAVQVIRSFLKKNFSGGVYSVRQKLDTVFVIKEN